MILYFTIEFPIHSEKAIKLKSQWLEYILRRFLTTVCSKYKYAHSTMFIVFL